MSVAVPSSAPTLLLLAGQSGATIRNDGNLSIYLSTDGSVNAGTAQWTLFPGSTLAWDGSQSLYAIAAANPTAEASISGLVGSGGNFFASVQIVQNATNPTDPAVAGVFAARQPLVGDLLARTVAIGGGQQRVTFSTLDFPELFIVGTPNCSGSVLFYSDTDPGVPVRTIVQLPEGWPTAGANVHYYVPCTGDIATVTTVSGSAIIYGSLTDGAGSSVYQDNSSLAVSYVGGGLAYGWETFNVRFTTPGTVRVPLPYFDGSMELSVTAESMAGAVVFVETNGDRFPVSEPVPLVASSTTDDVSPRFRGSIEIGRAHV